MASKFSRTWSGIKVSLLGPVHLVGAGPRGLLTITITGTILIILFYQMVYVEYILNQPHGLVSNMWTEPSLIEITIQLGALAVNKALSSRKKAFMANITANVPKFSA